MARKKEEKNVRVELCQGVELSDSFFERKESRLLTLLLKGFIVYLLSMGGIGFYLSAFSIEYNAFLCHIVILIMAFICAMLYYRLFTENMGYLLLLAVFAVLVVLFRVYINSGFYAIVNITVDNAAQYFDASIQRLYNEQISNRYVTVTCVVLFMGIVLDILLNVYISRRMQYATAIFFVMGLNMIPLYMILEPDLFYTIMLLSGVAMAYIYKSGRHYSPQVSIKRNDNAFAKPDKKRELKKKREISYVYDVKGMIQAGIIGVCVVLVVTIVVNAFRPKEEFQSGYAGNKYKELTSAAVSTLLIDGWAGFFRYSRDVGGLDSGRLGDVSTVRPDYQTDLVVQMTPYSFDRIYLKAFVGDVYNPYQNSWTSIEIVNGYDAEQTPEADALEENFNAGVSGTARSVMRVRNVGADVRRQYLPYYYKSYEQGENGYTDIVYYPNFMGIASVGQPQNYSGTPYLDADLYVPEENREAIAEFVDELGYLGTDEQNIQAVIDYYQENIPYTIRPGRTPRREDFVNYFLQENRMGYCAHFASAAVLIFRYMGIPARYVEGYAIDYNQMFDAELVENAQYSDYYEGFSLLGETALLQIEVSDADAHAWVEVYSSNGGWRVVEVTPAGVEEDVEDFWTMFEDIMDDGTDTTDDTGAAGLLNFRVSKRLIRGICYFILGVAGAFILYFIIRRGRSIVLWLIRFSKAGRNDRLIMKYTTFCRRIAKRDKEFAKRKNYEEQIGYIVAQNMVVDDGTTIEAETLMDILQRAGFSNREITQEEYDSLLLWMKKVKA